MAECQRVSNLALPMNNGTAGSIFTIKKECIFESFQPRKKSYDLQTSKEIQCPDAKNGKETRLPRVRCQYTFTFVGFLVFFLIGSLRINTSVSIVAMVNQTAIAQWAKNKSDSCLAHLPNSTDTDITREDGEFVWSPKIQGYILGSNFVGYAIVQIPSGKFAERFGAKWLLFSTILITSVTTLLLPAFSWIGVPAVLTIQILRGVAQGCSQPTISVLVSNWFTKVERGLLYSIIFTGIPMGMFAGGIYSGLLCDSYGRWPSSFYATGAFGVILCILILFLVYENADAHPRISKSELDFILSNQETKLSTRRPNVPWRKVLTSAPVYAMVYACFGNQWAVSQFVIAHATFLGTILDYPISQNGSLVAISFLLMFVGGQVGAWISSIMIKRNIASASFARKFINFVACLGFSACLVAICIVGCNRTLSIIFAVISTSFVGFGLASCWIVSAEMSPTFSATLCALCLSVGSLASFILPLVVGYLTEGMQTLEQWNKVFFISIGVVMSSGIVFAIFGSADVQPWNYVEKENSERENNKDKQTRF